MYSCVSCAISGVAVSPVPMAQTGSYAMTMLLHLLRRHARQPLAELRGAHGKGLARLALLLELADAEDGLEALVEHLERLLVDVLVGVAEDGPPLRVPDADVVAPDARQHAR